MLDRHGTHTALSDAQETFAKEGLNYTMEGQTGNSLNSHRLIAFAGRQGADVQDRVVEQLFKAYFTEVCPMQLSVCICIPVNLSGLAEEVSISTRR